jgi:hypothetical protein
MEPTSGMSNKATFEKGLAGYYLVHLAVICDPEVILPVFLKTPLWMERKDVVHLEYGLDMAVPITDLVVTENGVAATLSFSREPYHTFVPWKAVVGFACEDERSPEPKPRPKLGLVK